MPDEPKTYNHGNCPGECKHDEVRKGYEELSRRMAPPHGDLRKLQQADAEWVSGTVPRGTSRKGDRQ